MEEYILTFFTHYDAISFARQLRKQNCEVELAPVPRSLSSSCGTCACFAMEERQLDLSSFEYEQLFMRQGGKYILVQDNREIH